MKCLCGKNYIGGISVKESNCDFIYNPGPCELCGGDDVPGGALSTVKFLFGYGSRHDGESIELAVCGSCIDRLYNMMIKDRRNDL